jgi:hypothetical protein
MCSAGSVLHTFYPLHTHTIPLNYRNRRLGACLLPTVQECQSWICQGYLSGLSISTFLWNIQIFTEIMFWKDRIRSIFKQTNYNGNIPVRCSELQLFISFSSRIICSASVVLISVLYCKDTIPKIRNKYSQKRNCAASDPISTSCLCEWFIYIPTIGLPILLQENMWTNPGKIYVNCSQTY